MRNLRHCDVQQSVGAQTPSARPRGVAGSLGKALWAVGKQLLAAAAGAAAAWYAITGRPPP